MDELKNTDKKFPGLLKQISDCPKKLYCLGNIDLLNEKRNIAMVGSRKMSWYGKRVVNMLVPKLVENGFVIVSGMAFGIDAEAHRVCIENRGKTIAVLASGVNVISPKLNEWIYKKILANDGLIISEYKDNSLVKRENFLKRNRLISGISNGVIVVEGSKTSGSIITAKLALEQGREMMAVPGRIGDDNSYTPNFLIKNGATVITGVEDILNNSLL